jgi:putative tricarboxylic transport membrane protein
VTADRIAAVVILLVAVLYIREARSYHGLTVADVVGPSAYPMLIGGLAALLAIVQMVRSGREAEGASFWARHGRAVLFIVSLFAYILLMERLGFLLSTFAYLTLSHRWLGERAWYRAVGMGLAITLALWFLFDRTLDLRLPVGLLGLPR